MSMFQSPVRLAIAAAALSAASMGAPAHADSTGMFNLSVGNCGYQSRQVCFGYGQGVPVGLASLTVAISCSATSPFVVDRTGVGCYIVGHNDGRQYLHTGPWFTAGNASTTTNVGTVPFQGYSLCVGAGYSTSTGGGQAVQGHRCM
ncbi:MAG TPA: hypothetical protein VNQ77_20540 [Frankiaceae bacterium]|nr:hypothetical protein [Frankiaceae bacterium]